MFKGSLHVWFQSSAAVQLSTLFVDTARRKLVVTTQTTNVCRATSRESTHTEYHLHKNDCVSWMYRRLAVKNEVRPVTHDTHVLC